MKSKKNVFLYFTLIIFTLLSCSSPMSPESLFAISSDITPTELEELGFELIVGDGYHCMLEETDYLVSIGYDTNDKMTHLGINLSDELFREATKLDPADYDSVMIDNFPFEVIYYKESNSIFAGRLGL
ncbi:MAG: hypothetical protein QNK23_07440 [Crocinitomicaceae bacterium]|nr:hypothetical protein [Crocinitomicaceae bacterium]